MASTSRVHAILYNRHVFHGSGLLMFHEFAVMGLVLPELRSDADDGGDGSRHSGTQEAVS